MSDHGNTWHELLWQHVPEKSLGTVDVIEILLVTALTVSVTKKQVTQLIT